MTFNIFTRPPLEIIFDSPQSKSDYPTLPSLTSHKLPTDLLKEYLPIETNGRLSDGSLADSMDEVCQILQHKADLCTADENDRRPLEKTADKAHGARRQTILTYKPKEELYTKPYTTKGKTIINNESPVLDIKLQFENGEVLKTGKLFKFQKIVKSPKRIPPTENAINLAKKKGISLNDSKNNQAKNIKVFVPNSDYIAKIFKKRNTSKLKLVSMLINEKIEHYCKKRVMDAELWSYYEKILIKLDKARVHQYEASPTMRSSRRSLTT